MFPNITLTQSSFILPFLNNPSPRNVMNPTEFQFISLYYLSCTGGTTTTLEPGNGEERAQKHKILCYQSKQ